MTAINRLYASSGSEVIIGTLQIDIGGQTHYLCEGYEDITAVTERGETVTFIACAIVLSLPARNEDGMLFMTQMEILPSEQMSS